MQRLFLQIAFETFASRASDDTGFGPKESVTSVNEQSNIHPSRMNRGWTAPLMSAALKLADIDPVMDSGRSETDSPKNIVITAMAMHTCTSNYLGSCEKHVLMHQKFEKQLKNWKNNAHCIKIDMIV